MRWGDEELVAEKGGWNGLGMWQGCLTTGCQSLCSLVGSLSPAPGVVLEGGGGM